MKTLIITGIILTFGMFTECRKEASSNSSNHQLMENNNTNASTKEIYFAGGCFWGTEHFFKQVRGVTGTEVGYANGNVDNPDYEMVITGTTNYAETVKVKYDPEIVSLDLLIELFFETIDPTVLNRQGNDIGTQYRTGVYYSDKNDLPTIQSHFKELAKSYDKKLQIELMPIKSFYTGEEYHQDYLDKNPNGYCHIGKDLFEKARKANELVVYKKPDNKTLKEKLTPTQYEVTQNNGTERPFTNEYWKEFREGIYVDITTGEPLFVSSDKFDSDCGWPSFSKPIKETMVEEVKDNTLGMTRIEVRSKTGDSHLGHVFDDGPDELGGLRYCINSASLRFVAKADMQKEGYGKYISLVKSAPVVKHN